MICPGESVVGDNLQHENIERFPFQQLIVELWGGCSDYIKQAGASFVRRGNYDNDVLLEMQ